MSEYSSDMGAATVVLAPNLWDALAAEVQRLNLHVHAQILALHAENATLHTRIHELETPAPSLLPIPHAV